MSKDPPGAFKWEKCWACTAYVKLGHFKMGYCNRFGLPVRSMAVCKHFKDTYQKGKKDE